MLFNPAIHDRENPFSDEDVTQIAAFLLKKLLLLRGKEVALIVAESTKAYYSISQNCTQLVFFETPHRALDPASWDDLLLRILLSSPLPLHLPRMMVARIRHFSTFLRDLSAEFISLRMRRSITNIYQHAEDTKEADHVSHRYSATTGLVHETNLSKTSNHEDISKHPSDEFAFATVVRSLEAVTVRPAETKSQYRACLSRLFEVSPTFTTLDDQEDLYMSKPTPKVQSGYNHWLKLESSCIITTGGGPGVGKSLNARALFHELKKPSQLVAYFSFDETDKSRDSFESFLASVSFQVLTQDPERFGRVEDLFESMEASNTWTEASLLVLFQSLLDTTDGISPLHLIIDDLHNCNSANSLVEALTAFVSDASSPTKLKVALFYDWQEFEGDSALENILRGFNDNNRMYGPVLTMDMHKPLVAPIVDRIIIDRPYLSDLKSQLFEALERCKNTTEVLLAIQYLGTINAGQSLRTLKSLESLINKPQFPVIDVIDATFKHCPQWGRTALGWMIYCKCPLRLNELATAVALTDNRANFSSSFDPKSLPVDFSADIRSIFGPLVRIEGGRIIFSHKTVRNHFLGLIVEERKLGRNALEGSKSIIPNDADITGILFGYLSWKGFTDPVNKALPAESDEFIQPLGDVFGLMTYAVRFLPFHYRACKNSDNLPSFSQSCQLALMWPRLNSMLNRTASPPHLCVIDPLLLAAQLGLTEMIKRAGKKITGADREAAISLASWGGHVDTVRALLSEECVGHTKAVDTTRALEYASSRGYDEVIPHIVDYMRRTAPQSLSSLIDRLLCRAAELGYEKQVSQWLELDANVNAAPDDITPLQHATRNGHTSLVRHLLLDKKTDVSSKAGTNLDEPILLAAMKGYGVIVQHLLVAGADVACLTKDDTGRTPLYLAAEYGHEEVVRHLLSLERSERPAVDHQNSSGNSPLIIACTGLHNQVVDLLLESDANVTLCNKEGKTALFYALHPANEELVMKILRRTESAESFQDIGDVFLLAAKLGFKEVIEHCLGAFTQEKKAEVVEYSNMDGKKPLHNAASNGHLRIVELLLESGVDVDSKDTTDQTPLSLAAEAGQKETVKLLLEQYANACLPVSDGYTILCRVVGKDGDSDRHVDVVHMLLEWTDIDPNKTNQDQRTPLHLASSSGNFKIVKALLQHPTVDANITGKYHWNALHFLAMHNHKATKKIAELLIDMGTDPLGPDVDDWRPIHLASKHGNIPLLEVLLKHNPESLEAEADDGCTAIHFGLSHVESVKWLMEHRANGDTRDLEGYTPLMRAAARGWYESVRVLLDYKCDATLVDEEGRTALHFAAADGHVPAGEELLKKHIEILTSKDKTNLSAVHYAIRNNEAEFAKILLDKFYTRIDKETCLDDLNGSTIQYGETPLISAVKADQLEVVRQLLKLGADTEHRDSSGQTALLAAVEYRSLEIVGALLNPDESNHADVNAGGDAYSTALHEAARNDNMELCKELIRLNAQVNTQGGRYNTALGAAAASGCRKIAMFLLKEHKADPNLPAGDYANPLSAALDSHTLELVTPLLEAGVDVSATDIQGRSAFHIAARLGSWDIMIQLMGAGSPSRETLRSVDKQGRTVLHFAAMSGKRYDFLRFLASENMGWDSADITDIDGWTPLHWACRHNGNLGIVEALIMYGADPTKATNDGWTPENIAITHNATEVVSFIQGGLRAFSSDEQTVSCPKRWKVGYLHRIVCDSCLLYPIRGVRWHCTNCPDFDFCFKCYWTAKDTHNSDHKFIAMPSEGNTGRVPEIEEDPEQEPDTRDEDEVTSEDSES
ncbi:hypothetical protein Hte_007574 [Hypoxylon texense]